jgi:hypothetical protein
MDLQRWLEAAKAPVVKGFRHVDDATIDLWEGGVRFALHTHDGTVGLKFRQKEGGSAFAETASTMVAIELDEGASLSPRSEKAVRALLRALDKVDRGQVVVPKAAVEEDEPEPDADRRPQFDPRAGAVVASPARDLAQFGLACVADQRATLARWREPDLPVVRLEGPGFTGGRPLDAARAHLAEAGDAAIDVRGADPVALALVPAHATVYADPAQLAQLPTTVRAYTRDGGHRTVLRADEVDGQTGPVLVVPGTTRPLDEVAAALRALDDVAVAGLPDCVAPEVPREPVHASLLGAPTDGTVLTDACKLCDRFAHCPGIPVPLHEAHGMRGILPQFSD